MMLTRCPGCTTAFRVSAEQLKVKQGKVRCGQCRQVFNALSSLVDQAAPAPASESQPATAAPPPLEATEPSAPSPRLATDPEAPAAVAAEPASPAPAASPGYLDEVFAAVSYRRSHRGRAWAWGAAAMLAAGALLLQAALHFRVELGQSIAAANPLLQEASRLFGVDSSLPHKADLLGIETSDLHPGNHAQLVLTATLKNRAAFAQAFPHLELTLTDVTDQPLLRKVLAPAEYLPSSVAASGGFAANSEFAFDLTLEASVTGATGYRIYVFYP